MTPDSNAPAGLLIAAYSDPRAARLDWDDLLTLAGRQVISVEAMVLVSRDAGGTIRETGNAHATGVGSVLGACSDAFLGLIFPPVLLASAEAGSAAGLVSHPQKKEIKAEVAHDLAAGCSGIVVLLDDRWVPEVEVALAGATVVSVHRVDHHSVEVAKLQASREAAAGASPGEAPPPRRSSPWRDAGSSLASALLTLGLANAILGYWAGR